MQAYGIKDRLWRFDRKVRHLPNTTKRRARHTARQEAKREIQRAIRVYEEQLYDEWLEELAYEAETLEILSEIDELEELRITKGVARYDEINLEEEYGFEDDPEEWYNSHLYDRLLPDDDDF